MRMKEQGRGKREVGRRKESDDNNASNDDFYFVCLSACFVLVHFVYSPQSSVKNINLAKSSKNT